MEEVRVEFVIGGGGIAGLALALALQKEGKSVKVYERDVSFDCRKQGYSITMQWTGKRALKQLGLYEKVNEYQCRSTQYETLTSKGERVNIKPQEIPQQFKTTNIPIPRQLLRKHIIDEIKEPESIIEWGKTVKDIENNTSRLDGEEYPIMVTLTDGTDVYCKGYIGCEGIRSQTRQRLVGDKLHYLGVYAINGIANYPHEYDCMIKNRTIQSLDGHCRVFVKPFDENSVMWQLTFPVCFDANDSVHQPTLPEHILLQDSMNTPSPPSSDHQSDNNQNNNENQHAKDEEDDDHHHHNAELEKQMIMDGFEKKEILSEEEIEHLCHNTPSPSTLKHLALKFLHNFHAPIPDLIEATEDENYRGGFYFDRDPIEEIPRSKPHQNITIMGDAAHPMSPFKGQGANQALLDAVSLVKILKENNWNVGLSFSLFETEMFQRTRKFVLGSRSGVEFYHTQNALNPAQFTNFIISQSVLN